MEETSWKKVETSSKFLVTENHDVPEECEGAGLWHPDKILVWIRY